MAQQGLFKVLAVSSLAIFSLSGCGEESSQATESRAKSAKSQEDFYLISSPETQERQRLIIRLDSNVPGDIEVMVSVNLVGQSPDDIAVGTSQRASLRNGHGESEIKTSNIPLGEYEIKATFYPRWGFGNEDKIASIQNPITSEIQLLPISGSGEPAEQYLARENGRLWIINNVFPGTPWNPSIFQEKFGEWETFPATKRNPKIIKNYYFPKLDVTVVVNELKGELVTWAKGRDGM
ncbi:hypothetical protein [Thalassospira alkalitolerans]|uniref:hypothetical protein n=1 Tax=Thalassospira alkalitolerans TaxID=1293890 RepID=UPI0030EF489B|tara:strand:- start:39223 stop:39930 length:708 start_codon:yes stop_codon:yes gene_type:complete